MGAAWDREAPEWSNIAQIADNEGVCIFLICALHIPNPSLQLGMSHAAEFRLPNDCKARLSIGSVDLNVTGFEKIAHLPETHLH